MEFSFLVEVFQSLFANSVRDVLIGAFNILAHWNVLYLNRKVISFRNVTHKNMWISCRLKW